MQPIAPPSQSQGQAAAARISNPVDNQQPVTTFSRTVSSAHGLAGASTSTSEQPADDANKAPSDTGLVVRTTAETQALSVRSEPMSQSSIMAITTGRFNPLALEVVRQVRNRVIEDLQLPGCQHTYQPYFWLSELAHRQMAPSIRHQRTGVDIQSQVIHQLLMPESAAKQHFQSHFEYRQVDYGFTSVDAAGVPEKNYGVFASKPIAKGALLGIYSGIGYLFRTEYLTERYCDWRTKRLHRQFYEEMPDFMSYYRTVIAGLRGKEQTQRTTTKFATKAEAIDPMCSIGILPDHERYTPMHFVNSANEPKKVNTDFVFVTVNTGSDKFFVPALVARKNIAAGQELLNPCFANSDAETKALITTSAADEKAFYISSRDAHLDLIDKLNTGVPGRRPISPYVAAPAIDLSEVLQKSVRAKVTKNQPSGSAASGD